jgi:hypothetical protein
VVEGGKRPVGTGSTTKAFCGPRVGQYDEILCRRSVLLKFILRNYKDFSPEFATGKVGSHCFQNHHVAGTSSIVFSISAVLNLLTSADPH